MSAELIDLAAVRARRMPAVIPPPPPRPEAVILQAADLSMADYLATVGELCIRRITDNDAPLPPSVRVVLMKAVAVLKGQPT